VGLPVAGRAASTDGVVVLRGPGQWENALVKSRKNLETGFASRRLKEVQETYDGVTTLQSALANASEDDAMFLYDKDLLSNGFGSEAGSCGKSVTKPVPKHWGTDAQKKASLEESSSEDESESRPATLNSNTALQCPLCSGFIKNDQCRMSFERRLQSVKGWLT